jgi:hypothetical protein
MGCGSPLGDLFYLADSLLYAPPGFTTPPLLQNFATAEGPGVRARLYQMYGEGQITEEVFTALRALADKGQLRPADLAVHRARPASGIFDASHRPAGRRDPELANARRGIRSRLAGLAQARAASEKVLADLEARLAGLDERAVGKEQAARDALTVGQDETAARQRLAEKAELTLSRDRLATQAEALRADLARLDDLRAQLEAKAAELEAVQVRSRLAQEVLK